MQPSMRPLQSARKKLKCWQDPWTSECAVWLGSEIGGRIGKAQQNSSKASGREAFVMVPEQCG